MNQQSSEPFYSIARRAGDTLYLSGFGPVDDNMQVVGTSIEQQTTFTMQAISNALAEEGAGVGQLMRVNVFLLHMADRDGFNDAYMKFFPSEPMPTRRLVGAGDLFAGILVEIDGIAYLGEHHG